MPVKRKVGPTMDLVDDIILSILFGFVISLFLTSLPGVIGAVAIFIFFRSKKKHFFVR